MNEGTKVSRGRPKKVENVIEAPVVEQDAFDSKHDLPEEVVKDETSVKDELKEVIPEESYEEVVEKEINLPSMVCIDCPYRYKSSQCKSCVENVTNK